MIIDEAIVKQFMIDAPNLKTVNGYNQNYNKFINGRRAMSEIGSFPALWIDFNKDTLLSKAVGKNGIEERKLMIEIGVFIKTATDEGKLSEMMLMVKSDLNKFINQDSSITDYGTADHKVLMWGKVLAGRSGITKWTITDIDTGSMPMDGEGFLLFEITAIYYQSPNSISNYSYDV